MTNQSASWAILLLMLTPVASQFQLYTPPPIESITYILGVIFLFLAFIKSDKTQEHDKASTIITSPRYLEQFLDRFGFMIEGFSSAINQVKEKIGIGIAKSEKDG